MTTQNKKEKGGTSASQKKQFVKWAVAAAAVTLLGAYFLGGNRNKKRREHIKGWILKAKGEILEKLEKLKEIDERVYHDIVNSVIGRYRSMKGVNKEELTALALELKRHWGAIQETLQKKPKNDTKNSSRKTPKRKSKSSAETSETKSNTAEE